MAASMSMCPMSFHCVSHCVATRTLARFVARPAAFCRRQQALRATIAKSLRPVCSSTNSNAAVGGGGRRRRQTKPCLKDLAVQECRVQQATCSSDFMEPVHRTLPAFVRKFVLRHPSAAQLLCEFEQVYIMYLQCPVPAEEKGTTVTGMPAPPAAPAAAPAPAPAPTSRLLDALTPRQRAAAHLCRVGEDDFYLIGFAQARMPLEYEDPSPWVYLLHVPPALRGHGLGRAMLDRMIRDVFETPPAVSHSVVDCVEHWG